MFLNSVTQFIIDHQQQDDSKITLSHPSFISLLSSLVCVSPPLRAS